MTQIFFNMLQLHMMYRHIKSGRLYRVRGLARNASNPFQVSVMYEQQEDTVIRGTKIVLAKGTLWYRDLVDFKQKFIPDKS